MFSWVKDWVDGFKTWEAYCFTCKTKRKMGNPKTKFLGNGRETRQGRCVVCGTNLSLISGHKERA